MGQIQNSIDGLVAKGLAATVGRNLEKADAEGKAYAAQESAARALEDKAEADGIAAATEAYQDHARRELESKADKYGLLRDDKGNVITGVIPADSRLSKDKGARRRQLNSVEASRNRLDKAIEANDYARQVADFKTAQYESFKKRTQLLAKKAKMDLSTLTDFQKAEEAYKLNMDNRYTMPSDLQEILDGGKR